MSGGSDSQQTQHVAPAGAGAELVSLQAAGCDPAASDIAVVASSGGRGLSSRRAGPQQTGGGIRGAAFASSQPEQPGFTVYSI